MSWHRLDPASGTLTLTIHAQPNAAHTAVAGRHGDALKIRLAAPALDNRANRCLLEFVAEQLGVKPAAVKLLSGEKARRKIVTVTGVADARALFPD